MLSRQTGLCCIAVILCTLSYARAVPTKVESPDSWTSDSSAAVVPATVNVFGPSDSRLVSIGREIVRGNVGRWSRPVNSKSYKVKSLPAVPAAVLMGLTGFLCISFVRDRRFWVTAAAGLLWAGQVGIESVPQLVQSLRVRTLAQQGSLEKHLGFVLFEQGDRSRGEIEGTSYIGLLHHLAGIPLKGERVLQVYNRGGWLSFCTRGENGRDVSQVAAAEIASVLLPEKYCPARVAGDFVLFSPAFIFQRIPRGPPNRKRRVVF